MDPCSIERVFDYFGGHINDQSDLQGAQFCSLSAVNDHQDREVEALQVQTQHLSVLLIKLLGDYLSLTEHVRFLQNAVSADDFFRAILPVPFVSSFERTDGQGKDSSSESSDDSNPDSSPSTPPQSFQTCVSGSMSEKKNT